MSWYKAQWGGDAEGWIPPPAVVSSGPPAVSGTKMLAYYDATNASPKTDQTLNGYNLTDTGTTIAVDANAFGTGKAGFNMLGSGALMVSSVAQGGGSDFWMACLFRMNSGSGNFARIMAYADPAQSNDYDNNGSVVFERNSTNAQIEIFRNSITIANTTVSYDTTIRVIAEFDGSNCLVRIDGVDKTPVTFVDAFVTGGKFFLGGGRVSGTDGSPGNQLVGKIGRAAFGKGSLTSTERNSLDTWLAAGG